MKIKCQVHISLVEAQSGVGLGNRKPLFIVGKIEEIGSEVPIYILPEILSAFFIVNNIFTMI